MACFIIALVLTIPFYTADVMAVTVSVDKNSGRDNLNGYLNGKGDVWTVQAAVTNIEGDLNPNDLSLVLGGRGDEFDSCNSNDLGFMCEYISDVSTGVPEDSYTFEVKHLPSNAGDGDTIVADSSAPEISSVDVRQMADGKVHLDFRVQDLPSFGVGISRIEILDAETQQVLQEINGFSERDTEFNYASDYGTDGIFTVSSSPGVADSSASAGSPSGGYFSGQGDKLIKIRASDKFGHQKTAGPFRFKTDFVKPVILGDMFTLPGLTDFMGSSSAVSRLVINVTETNELKKLTAFSDQIEFAVNEIDPATSCVLQHEETIGDYYTCTWTPIRVLPSASVSIQFKIEDKVGNILEQTLSKTFVVDTSAPEVDFFGTQNIYQDQSYISDKETLIILKMKESGAGMSLDGSGILADLSPIGAGSSVSPDSCEQTPESFNCNFTVDRPSVSGSIESIHLTKLTDKVGNEGPHVSTDLIVDMAAPHINRLEFLGLSGEREKQYYESGDKLLFRMNITEVKGGLFFKVNMNDVLMGAEAVYPASRLNEAGWQVFTEEDCSPEGDDWTCEFVTTGELKSGHQSAAKVELVLEDTAGNKVEGDDWDEVLKKGSAESRGDGRFIFEKRAVEDETSPDYWEVASAVPLGGEDPFIDIAITPLVSTRMPVAVRLKADDRNAQILEVKLVGCENDLGALGRDVLWNNLFVNPASSPVTVNLILEFPPFDVKEFFGAQLTADGFTKAYLNAKCAIEIYTAKDNKALSFSEEEIIEVKIPFGFTSLGSQEAALAATIAKEKEALTTGFWGFMDTLNTIVKIVKYLALAAQLIVDIVTVWNLAEAVVDAEAGALELLKPIPVVGEPISEIGFGTRVAFCLGNQLATESSSEIIEVLQVPLEILSCKKTLCDAIGGEMGDDWYVLYSCSIVRWYNTFTNSINNGVLNLAGEPTKGGGQLLQGGKSLIMPTEENIKAAEKLELVPTATSVEDNLYLSIASLCIPGVIKNVEKYRQIKCRKLYCLMNEVPQGVATIESCNKLEDVLTCKYFFGPLFQLIPLVNLWDNFLSSLQALLTDPIAWVSVAVYLPCATICLFPLGEGSAVAKLHPACGVSYVLLKITKIINDAYEGGKQLAQEFSDQGADFCEMVLTEEEETPAEELSEEQLAAAQAQGNADTLVQDGVPAATASS